MLAIFRRTAGRLFGGATAWLYMTLMALTAATFLITFNLYEGDSGFSLVYQSLSLALIAAVPLLTMNAFARDRALGTEKLLSSLPLTKRQAMGGRLLGYLAVHAAASLLVLVETLLIHPSAEALVCALGFFSAGAALIALCLGLAWLCPGRLSALTAGLLLMLLLRFIPEIAGLVGINRAGAIVGRALIWLSPLGRMSYFVSGIADLTAVGCSAALCLLVVGLSGDNGRNKLNTLVLVGALLGALALLPASIAHLDATEGRVATLSDEFVQRVRGVNTKVTLYQVAPVGEENPWVYDFLDKLSERHIYVRFAPTAPGEDARIHALALEANSLIVENGEDWVIVRAEDLYAEHQTLEGLRVSFELEGVLLSALTEATGIDLVYEGVPAGRALTGAGLALEDFYAACVMMGLMAVVVLLALVSLILFIRRRRIHA